MKKAIKLGLAFTVIFTTLLICTVSANAALVGDIEGNDNLVTSADARVALRASVGLDKLTEEQKKIADTDEDGSITSSDARTILRMSVALDPVAHYYSKEQVKAPTCTEKGLMKFTCTECTDVYEKDTDALGHDFPAPEVLTAVTCDTDGFEKYTCKREGCGFSEEKKVPAGHTPDIPAATCTQDQLCTRGNHVITEKLGHTSDWGSCGRCKVFITAKYEAQAATIKAKFSEAKTAFDAAYAINSYNSMLDGLSWKVLPNTKAAQPNYLKAKTAYEAALAACGDIPEFAGIKTLLAKNTANINAVLSQVNLILKEDFVDTRNFEELVWPLEELNDFNSDSIRNTNNKLSKLIIW